MPGLLIQNEFMIGNYSKAIEKLNELIELQQTDQNATDEAKAHTHYCIGIAFRNLDKTEQCIESFTKSLKLDPHHFGVNIQLAKTLLEIGEFELSTRYSKMALGTKPTSAAAIVAMMFAVKNEKSLSKAASRHLNENLS